jgi:hypothetical protein
VLRVGLVVLTLAAMLGSGCGGESAEDVLRETASNLGEIRSGDLDTELRFAEKSGAASGFTLAGPFSLDAGPLVAGRLDYSRLGGTGNEAATFVSTGEKAYVEVAGTAYELPAAQTSALRAASGGLASGGLEQLDLTQWIRDPELEDGGEVGGDDTDRVSGRLDVAAAVNTLVQLMSALGGGSTEPVSAEDAERLRAAVASSRVSLWTGSDDRLLRKLELAIQFEPTAAPARIRNLVGVDVLFRVTVSEPNSEVTIEAPEDVQPYSELGSG